MLLIKTLYRLGCEILVIIYAFKIIKPCRQKEQIKTRTNRATPMTHPDRDGWTMNWILPAGQEHHLHTVWCISKKPSRGFSFQSRVRQSTLLFEKVVFIGKQIWKSKFKYSKRIKQYVKKPLQNQSLLDRVVTTHSLFIFLMPWTKNRILCWIVLIHLHTACIFFIQQKGIL